MKTLLPVLLALVVLPASAAKTVAVTPLDIAGVKALDEVVVTGDRTLSGAHKAMIEAEDRFYSRWNDLNEDRNFDIRCHREIPHDAWHHSRITRRVCQPAFLEDMAEMAGQETTLAIQGGMTAGVGAVMMPSTNPAFVLSMQVEMRKRTLALLERDPELKRALIERARLEQHYEALRKEKLKNRSIVWD